MWQTTAAIVATVAALAGCGGGGGTSTVATTTGSINTPNGTTATQLAVSAPAGVALSIPAGTTLTDGSGTPVTGTVNTTVSYSTKTTDLPTAAATLPAGTALAGFADITMGTVKNFSQPVSLTLPVVGASAGDTLEVYSFSSSAWKYEGQQSVTSSGTITPTISHLSVWAAFKTSTPHPVAPGGVAATAGDTQATVTWNAVTGATSYNVYYGTSTGVTAATGTKVSASSTSQAVTGLTNGTKYYFVVTAVNAVGESVASTEVSTTPMLTKPAGIMASATADTEVTLKWTMVSGLTYNIYYATSSGVTTATGTKIAGVTSPYVISNLTYLTKYYFVVTAVDGNGVESPPSSEKNATPGLNVPATPTGTKVTLGAAGSGNITYSWTAPSNATSYNVYYLQAATAPASGAALVADPATVKVSTPNTSQTFTLTSGQTYYFNVTAVNANGESAPQTSPKPATAP